MIRTTSILLVSMAAVFAPVPATAQRDWPYGFQLSSTTFANNDPQLPLSMIANVLADGAGSANTCAYNGELGGDQAPELSWTRVPWDTRSFVVVLYDVTASFTHWGIYNISPTASGLPQNAGVSDSSFGDQISNDFGNIRYDGPCPPTNSAPLSHDYVFTVYALDAKLAVLPAFGDFPPGAQALYHALLTAGREGHILASASARGFYSAAIAPGP
jgi:Raf kinase inhibitor-like YbhB/YbcL family protein